MREGAHGRRGFFREVLRGASRAAGELASAAREAREPLEPVLGSGGIVVDPDPVQAPTVPATPATRLASPADLRALCVDVGLAGRADDAASLARTSIRLTPGGEGRSQLGGGPALPPGFAWPAWEGEELALVAQLRLAELPASPLPRRGTLLLFFALGAAPAGSNPSHAGACRVVLVDEDGLVEDTPAWHLPAVPVAASPELTLPPEPTALPLSAAELDAWTELRGRLAALQGVELEERSHRYRALHRLLGYPDALAETMEIDAELVSRGIDLDREVPSADVDASAWRLLFQLSSDDDAGVAFGYDERLYLWIRDEDLRAARFGDVRAFVR